MSECISSPSVSESGASHSFQISLQVTLACSHASHVTVAPSSISCTPSTIPLLTIFQMESRAICVRCLCMITMSTRSSRIEATYTCSALYRPCLLAWIAPMGFLALLNMWHTSVSNTTLQPLQVIQLTDTIVIPMSRACKTSLRTMGVEDLSLGTSILRSPMPTA
jgi:hypothetical protein